MAPIASALTEWEKTFAIANYVVKGSNMWTEQCSAVRADVPDPSTLLNTDLIARLEKADVIACFGQALSHCVANTIRNIADNFAEENISKLVLVEDTSSSVSGFEALGE